MKEARTRVAISALVISAGLVVGATATAQMVQRGASLDGGEAGVVTTAFGDALGIVDTSTGAIFVSGTYTGLSGNITQLNVHGPAGRGFTAPVVLGLNGTGTQSGTFSGNGFLTAQGVQDFLAGNHYVEVDTTAFPFGEIRGQLDLVQSRTLSAQLVSDPTLTDTGGTPGLGPNIADPLEPWEVRIDCTGSPTSGIYAVIIRPMELSSPFIANVGAVWLAGPLLFQSTGFHNQSAFPIPPTGPLVLPNDPSLPGLSYVVQGFCGNSVNKPGRTTNALVETIGLP